MGDERFNEFIGNRQIVLPLFADTTQPLAALQLTGDATSYAKFAWQDADAVYFRNDPQYPKLTKGTFAPLQGEWTFYNKHTGKFVGFGAPSLEAEGMEAWLGEATKDVGGTPGADGKFDVDHGFRARWDLTPLEELEGSAVPRSVHPYLLEFH